MRLDDSVAVVTSSAAASPGTGASSSRSSAEACPSQGPGRRVDQPEPATPDRLRPDGGDRSTSYYSMHLVCETPADPTMTGGMHRLPEACASRC
jgi:hypothetical protein